MRHYDVIVIGGGHAGCEAAWAAARMGADTALVTLNLNMIAQMSCNPSIGGIAKGHLVREIDALGGIMGRVADRTGIQFRLLNRSRGPAVRAPRAQCDKELYRAEMQRSLAALPNLRLVSAEVAGLVREGSRVTGVRTAGGELIACTSLVLTTGTFLNGVCHMGEHKFAAGRSGEKASLSLAESVGEIGFVMGRLKTGTPPRLKRESIDFSTFQVQEGDADPTFFSFATEGVQQPQVCCWSVYTNPAVHRILRDNLERSPLYSGEITGIGPRYCPSIEDKVVKFADRSQHQLFLEPESLTSNTIYINGLSTSMPLDVQRAVLDEIEGLERSEIIRPGYAVEYDFVQPTELLPTLETRKINGIYHAGQINGTTGYEEAAAQGLVAGVNAALAAARRPPFVLSRGDSYIGILVDDLVTRGVDEPYRMFTSRAEYRLLLRIDNADRRLTGKGWRLGLVNDASYRKCEEKWARIDRAVELLSKRRLKKSDPVCGSLETRFGARAGLTLEQLLKRPQVHIRELRRFLDSIPLSEEEAAIVETHVKYAGYIEQQLRDVERLQSLDARPIPEGFLFEQVEGLSREIVERLNRARPSSLGQASRLPGMTPAALSILNIGLELRRRAGS